MNLTIPDDLVARVLQESLGDGQVALQRALAEVVEKRSPAPPYVDTIVLGEMDFQGAIEDKIKWGTKREQENGLRLLEAYHNLLQSTNTEWQDELEEEERESFHSQGFIYFETPTNIMGLIPNIPTLPNPKSEKPFSIYIANGGIRVLDLNRIYYISSNSSLWELPDKYNVLSEFCKEQECSFRLYNTRYDWKILPIKLPYTHFKEKFEELKNS